ncbi:MAG: hypothetical protein AAB074_14335 [Planctomycetota bacterium]
MRLAIALSLFAVAAAGCGKDDGGSSSSGSSASSGSNARRISGGSEQRFGGVAFDIPSNWKPQLNQGKLGLVPEGANASGVLEEAYGVVTDPTIKSIDGPDADRIVQEISGAGATKQSGPDSRKFGDLDGRVWIYTMPAQNGKTAEVRLYAFMGDSACAFVALGLPEFISKRDKDIEAILGSMSKAAPAAAATGSGGSSVRQELCGKWIWISTFAANNGGGRQTDTWIILDVSGRYKWHYEHVSTNPNGAAWGSEDETGTWSATDTTISFKTDRGGAYTQQLVKRNHPKNTGDPMIVLDGKPYVTATNRKPW